MSGKNITKCKRFDNQSLIGSLLSSFHGFETEEEAMDFSNHLKETMLDEMIYENPKETLH